MKIRGIREELQDAFKGVSGGDERSFPRKPIQEILQDLSSATSTLVERYLSDLRDSSAPEDTTVLFVIDHETSENEGSYTLLARIRPAQPGGRYVFSVTVGDLRNRHI